MTGYVPGEQPRDPGILKLNTNENPYPPSPRVEEALRAISGAELSLYPSPDARPVREALADLHGCGYERIIVGNGSDELLSLSLRAFVERGGTVAFFEPSYSLYPVLGTIEEANIRRLELDDHFEWRMPGDFKASLFFLTNPNAPTGKVFPKETVATFCETFAGVVVIDEAYVDFADGNCLDLALGLDNVVVVRTLSKSFSLAGIRLGYTVAPAELVEAMMKIKDSYNVNLLSQNVALAALSDIGHVRKNVNKIKKTRERTAQALTRKGFVVVSSATNFLWVKPPEISAEKLFEQLKNKRILVRHFPGEKTRAYLRVTIGTDKEMDRLLEAL